MHSVITLPVAFLAGTIAAGLQHWRLPYRQAELPMSALGPGLVALAIIAALLVGFRLAPTRRAMAATLACLPAVVMARVVADTWQDPSAHNLWPFELVLALLTGAVAVLPGIGLGLLMWRVLRAGG